jgi:hypothetical protein
MFTLYGAASRRRTEPPWIAEQHAGLDGSTFKIIHKTSNFFSQCRENVTLRVLEF